MIKAIAFDLDHTLYNRDFTWDNLLPQFITTFQYERGSYMSQDKILKKLKAADKKATYEEKSWRGMYEELVKEQVLCEKAGFEKFYAFICQYFPDAIVPYPDTYDVLTWCRENNYRPSIITNGHPGLQERKIKSMNLENYVEECIICNLDSGVGCKPEPDAFLELAGRLRLLPDEILYVGDNPINDIQGARNAGMKTAWLDVMDNWDSEIAPADYEISALCELQRLIKKRHRG